jgi:hypothetical protein
VSGADTGLPGETVEQENRRPRREVAALRQEQAFAKKRTMTQRPLVAFDEAGNTGQALLDPAQPVFALASVHVAEDRARALVAPLVPKGGREAKFAGRRGAAWEDAVVTVLDSDVITNTHVKISVYHKSFMVTTKIVDLLVEFLLHRMGFDLYADAGNLALANLLHSCVPAFCGREESIELQRRFIEMVRRKSSKSIDAFYSQVGRLRRRNKNKGFDETL